MERARTVLSNPDEAAAVLSGAKTIHQAAHDSKAKRLPVAKPSSAGSKQHHRSKSTLMTNEDAIAEGHRILLLLNALSASDPDESRKPPIGPPQ